MYWKAAVLSKPTGEIFTMKTLTRTQLLLMTALVAGSSVTLAQTSTTPAMGASQPATSVGVTPQTAAEANRKAVPRSDTATVVRTSPNAVDSTRNATGMNNTTSNSGASGMNSTTGTSGMNGTTSMNGTAGGTGDTTGRPSMRKARADRN